MPGRGRDGNVDSSRDGSGQTTKGDVAYDHHTLMGPDTIDEEKAQGGFLRKDHPEGGKPRPNFTPGGRGRGG